MLGADEVGVSGSKHVEGGDMSLEGGNGGRAVFLLFFFHLFFQARAGRAGAMLVSAAPSNGLVFHRTSERQHFRTVNTIKNRKCTLCKLIYGFSRTHVSASEAGLPCVMVAANFVLANTKTNVVRPDSRTNDFGFNISVAICYTSTLMQRPYNVSTNVKHHNLAIIFATINSTLDSSTSLLRHLFQVSPT